MADNKTDKAKAMTKSTIYQELATETELSKKQVTEVFDSLTSLIKRELGKKGPGVFTIPGLLKVVVVKKGPTKARKGRNPQTGEEMVIKAKPARTIVRARVLKALKEMVK